MRYAITQKINETEAPGKLSEHIDRMPFMRVWRNNTDQALTENSAQRFSKRTITTIASE